MPQRTKIIATLGPASQNEIGIRSLIAAGADAFRLNFSYGRAEEHERTVALIRQLSLETSRHVAVIQDLQGPKVRIGQLEGGYITVKAGQQISMVGPNSRNQLAAIPVKHPDLVSMVSPGDRILLGDGELELAVESIAADTVVALAKADGTIKETEA